MRDLTRWIRASQLSLIGVALLGTTGQARQTTTLGSQMAGMTGKDLTRAECQQRLQTLGKLLQQAGYGLMHSRVTEDGMLMARWYHPGQKTSVLAFTGQNAESNSFAANQFAGMLRWNELLDGR